MTPLSTPAAQGTVAGWKHRALVVQIIEGMRRFHRRGGLGMDTHEALETWIDGLEAVIAAPLSSSPSPEALPAGGVEALCELIKLRIIALDTPPCSARKDFAIEELRFVLQRASRLSSAPAPATVESDHGGIAKVLAEVQRAMRKFPTWPTDPLHAVSVLGEEFGELTKEALQLTYEPHKSTMEDFRKEAIQTAAMALRFVASLDSYQFSPGQQHEQAAITPAPEDRP